MRPVIGPVSVSIFHGLEPEGEEYRRCRLTFLGDSPTTAQLWQFVGGRWLLVDTLTTASVVETDAGMVITGASRTLISEVGLDPANAQARWNVEATGCQNCN